MPKIIQRDQSPVSTQIAQQPKAQSIPTGAFGGAIGKGVVDLATSAAQVKQRIDTTSAEEALNAFERDKNDVFFNPESGYFNTSGKNAFDGSPAAAESLEELKRKYGETLNSNSKLMFDKSADKHITRNKADITRHAAKGLKAWEVSTIETQVENTLENASLYWNDPERLKVQNVLGRQAVIDSSEMMGVGPEATAEKLQTYESSFARASVEAATQSSANAGKQALNDYGDKLEGPDKVKMEGLIEKKAKVEKTEGDARLAVLTSTNLNDTYDKRGDIVDEVNKIEDADLRKKTMTEAMSQFSRQKQARQEVENEHYNTSVELVNSGLSSVEIQAQNPEAWEGMTSKQRNNILSGKHMVTDQLLFSQLRLMPVKEKAKLNPLDYSGRLNPRDIQKLTTEVNAAKKGNPGSRVKSLTSKSMTAAEGAFGKKSKWINSSGKVTSRGESANSFLGDIQDAIDEFEDENHRKITPAEEDSLIGEFTRRIVVERSSFGFDILAADTEIDLSNSPPNDVRLLNRVINESPDIDLIDLTESYQFLIDNNQPVTSVNLREVYKQGRK